MIKKKAKGKTAATKETKKKTRTRKAKTPANPADVRKDIAKIVKSGAKKITKAVMEQAMTGQLAPAKFLFEMAAIFPPSTDGSETTQDEDCFAKSLMDRLGLPDKPIALAEEEDEGVKSADPLAAAGDGEETGGKESDEGEAGSEATGGERKHVSALV